MDNVRKYLMAAIERHKRHMNGTEATDEASQKKLMQEMMLAMQALDAMKEKHIKEDMPSNMSRNISKEYEYHKK